MQGAGNGGRATSVPIIRWMVVAGCAAVTAQIIRLQQTDPAAWLCWDYAGRIAVLALLAANPAVRAAVYSPQRLSVSLAIVINWGLLLIPIFWASWIAGHIYAAFLPTLRLGSYPRPEGWLLIFDLTIGLALVALHEEIVFRRAMYLALGGLGEGRVLILVSGVLFGAYHWWSGVPNMITATVFGLVAMQIYCRSGALWPIVVIYYLSDLWCFA